MRVCVRVGVTYTRGRPAQEWALARALAFQLRSSVELTGRALEAAVRVAEDADEAVRLHGALAALKKARARTCVRARVLHCLASRACDA